MTAMAGGAKNGHPREVRLSLESVRPIGALPQFEPVFEPSPRQLDGLWGLSQTLEGPASKGLAEWHTERPPATFSLLEGLIASEHECTGWMRADRAKRVSGSPVGWRKRKM